MPLQPDAAINFEIELNALAQQAAQAPEEKSRPKDPPSLAQALRPLVIGIEAISRAQAEQAKTLAKIDSFAQVDELTAQLAGVKDAWEHKEAIMERLFSSLHGELKTYKDDFLFDLLHKPVVKDLITLFDDLTQIQSQLANISEMQRMPESPDGVCLGQVEKNLHHGIHALEEVLSRLQVEKLIPHSGILDKKLQRVVGVTDTGTSDLDNTVAQSLRPGFIWRDRVIRPEEIIIFRHQPAPLS